MPRRDWLIRIRDILEAIEKIHKYTVGMTDTQFFADERTIDAVIRNFTIIGEAANQVPEAVQGANPAIPWAEMIGMRNIVVHGYHKVSVSTVWVTLQSDLPNLVPQLKALLSS